MGKTWTCRKCRIEVDGQFCGVCGRDIEGMTYDERMVPRPKREVHGADQILARKRALEKEQRKGFRPDERRRVKPGSIRTSRPIFGEE